VGSLPAQHSVTACMALAWPDCVSSSTSEWNPVSIVTNVTCVT
jgi:hypothetical protein